MERAWKLQQRQKPGPKGNAQLLPQDALSAGWRYWIGLMAVSAVGLIVVMATQPIGEQGSGGLAGPVLVGVSVAWLVLLGTTVLILRSYCFRAVWDGRPVEPGSYLKGMYQVWGVLVMGVLLAVLGSVLMGTLMPGGLVVVASVLLLIFARPSGRALGV